MLFVPDMSTRIVGPSGNGLLKLEAPRSVLLRSSSITSEMAQMGDGDNLLLTNSSLSRSGSKSTLASLSRSQSPIKTLSGTKSLSGSLSQVTNTLVSPEERRALDAILPPQEWTDNAGTSFTQKVSSTPAMPADVTALQDLLDRELRQRQARETGICPIRSELYSYTYDELIRQITINSLEQGLLLLRVRNEIRMTIASYQKVYESSLAYGMRRTLQTEVLKRHLSSEIAECQAAIENLKAEIANAAEQCDVMQKEAEDARMASQKRHEEEVAELVEVRDTLTRDLEAILTKKNF